MINDEITKYITQGMYVLTTEGGGCMVDSVSQVSAGATPLIAVAVNKTNYTHELMTKNSKFALSILGKDVDPHIIDTFGLNSTREIDKFANTQILKRDNLDVIEDSIGYMICEKVDSIDTGTHTLFIGKMVESETFKTQEPMSYGYYQEHKEELMSFKTETGKTAWICTVCGYVYYGETIDRDFTCPICGVKKDAFKLKS